MAWWLSGYISRSSFVGGWRLCFESLTNLAQAAFCSNVACWAETAGAMIANKMTSRDFIGILSCFESSLLFLSLRAFDNRCLTLDDAVVAGWIVQGDAFSNPAFTQRVCASLVRLALKPDNGWRHSHDIPPVPGCSWAASCARTRS